MADLHKFSGSQAVTHTYLPGIPIFRKGKVRDVYDLGEHLLLVATDRISAFDVIMPNGIPDKGRILTQMSLFWFDLTEDIIENHLVAHKMKDFPSELQKYSELLEGRSLLVKKTAPYPIECVARGYLAGGGWSDYQNDGAICGIKLPEGLQLAQRLPETIFTPASKADTGHDENISFDKAAEVAGVETVTRLRELTLSLYEKARIHAKQQGIIIADTKFEFGQLDGKIILIDEILTPDSSRFWPASSYEVGKSPLSFDKQYVRDYLETLVWDKTPPAPELPEEVAMNTRGKYLEAYELLTGEKFRITD
jgi:phosphoribosylaminoimidazole-succinocarboxamide synthase